MISDTEKTLCIIWQEYKKEPLLKQPLYHEMSKSNVFLISLHDY